jgi:predicted alpha/beta superfamily hydrolase
MKTFFAAAAIAAMALSACSGPVDARTQETEAPSREGRPYEIQGTQVWSVPDPASGRVYEVFISLPPSYESQPNRRYPVVYITDADYAFPMIRSLSRRLNLDGPEVQEAILVGLSYARGDDGMTSRRRDYTPTARGPSGAPAGAAHGQGAAYQRYLKTQVLPFVEDRFRADSARRVFVGHSYGSLLGAQILFTEPTLFHDYILGSPSFWYDDRHMLKVEADYARSHRDLPANVFMYVGAFEAVRAGDPRYARTRDMVADMATFESRLKSRAYPGLTIRSEVLADENHLTVAPRGYTRALLSVLPTD